jgi:translation initiation factor eIF-2B subunit delta
MGASGIKPEIAAIRDDRLHGAGWLSRQALAVMKLTAEKSNATTISDFLAELSSVAKELLAARPSMAAIANSVLSFLLEILERAKKESNLASLRDFACSKGDEFIAEAERAALKAAKNGAGIIEDGDRVMTCSYSSTVCHIFKIAKDKERGFEVLVAESEFGGKTYGELAAAELKGYGIPVEVVPDDAIDSAVARASRVVVGADSVLEDGSLINGIPTYRLAVAAKECKIPFYAVCEMSKFNIQGDFELEPGFDLIPVALIAGIITEKGLIKPEEVIAQIR